jgi:hypothetical protein
VKAMIETPSMPLFADGVHTSRYHSLRNTKVWKEEHDRKLLYAISKYSTFFCSHSMYSSIMHTKIMDRYILVVTDRLLMLAGNMATIFYLFNLPSILGCRQ